MPVLPGFLGIRGLKASFVLVIVLLSSGCSPRQLGTDLAADALAEQGSLFASDDDPDLIREAAPFSLKLIEGLIAAQPEQKKLLTAAARGFTQYAYAFVQQDADEAEDRDINEAYRLRERARGLYRRARDYGLRGLAVGRGDFVKSLRADPAATLAGIGKKDVPLLYWTGAAWGGWIALTKDDPGAVADAPLVLALLDRTLALDESFDQGALHSLFITLEPNRPAGASDAKARAEAHFHRALALTHGKHAGPYVAFAEAVALPGQEHKQFESLLNAALAVDPDGRPEWRLENRVMQHRARWLLARTEKLFLE